MPICSNISTCSNVGYSDSNVSTYTNSDAYYCSNAYAQGYSQSCSNSYYCVTSYSQGYSQSCSNYYYCITSYGQGYSQSCGNYYQACSGTYYISYSTTYNGPCSMLGYNYSNSYSTGTYCTTAYSKGYSNSYSTGTYCKTTYSQGHSESYSTGTYCITSHTYTECNNYTTYTQVHYMDNEPNAIAGTVGIPAASSFHESISVDLSGLTITDPEGDAVASYKIYVQPDGGSWTLVDTADVTGGNPLTIGDPSPSSIEIATLDWEAGAYRIAITAVDDSDYALESAVPNGGTFDPPSVSITHPSGSISLTTNLPSTGSWAETSLFNILHYLKKTDWTNATLGARVVDITELREQIDYARELAGLSPMTWTDSTIQVTTLVKKQHIEELQTGAIEVRNALGPAGFVFRKPNANIVVATTQVEDDEFENIKEALDF